jgi:hypothetical protein
MKLAALLTYALLSAAPKPAALAAEEVPKFEDAAVKGRLKVITDTKGHFLAFDPSGSFRGPMFYSSDGKAFYLLRSSGGGSSADTFSASLWDPRIDWKINGNASFDWREGKYTVSCPPKTTELIVVNAEEAKKLLEGATLYQAKWQRRPHKLARDDKGNYYFVDCARDDNSRAGTCERDWRLYVGQRGKMKLQQMTNIVHDTEGEIFATKTGELRLVLTDEVKAGENAVQRKDMGMKWVAGKVANALINVPVDVNARMIYTELGIYDRERLGTPCDDM